MQLSIALLDSQGKELLCKEEEWQLYADPVVQYDIPADGDYVIAIKDSIDRGREDFIYRVRVGELPWVTTRLSLRRTRRHHNGRGTERLESTHYEAHDGCPV